MARIEIVWALASSVLSLLRWPPAMWPVSCASTPMIWFGVAEFEQGAGIDEDAVPVHHEGVERAIIDDDDADILLGEPGRAQDRLRVVAQHLLDLRIADDREAARLRGDGRGHAGQRDRAGRHRGDRAKRVLSQLALDRSVCCAHSN